MTDIFIGNGLVTFNTALSPKTDIDYIQSAQDVWIQHASTQHLDGGGLIPGGAIYYGGIAIFDVRFNAADAGSGIITIREDSLGLSLTFEVDTGKLEVAVAGMTVDPRTTTTVFTGDRFVIAGAVAGDGVNQFAQIWVDGVQESANSEAYAGWPSQLPAYTPYNRQDVYKYAFIPLTEAVTSQAELTSLLSAAIEGF